LKPDGDLLKKVRDETPYMVVRLPQQHAGEEIKPETPDARSKIYTSGFSYLTFEVLGYELLYQASSILDWSNDERFRLVDTKSTVEYPDYKTALLSDKTYPFQLTSNPSEHPFLLKSDGEKKIPVPVTLFELPYKMYLSPIAPYIEKEDKPRLTFAKHNTQLKMISSQFETENGYPGKVDVFELWNNDVVYKQKQKFGYKFYPPSFKILGYANNDNNTELLPKEGDRKNLMHLTQLGVGENHISRDFDRDVKSQYFNISSLGSSISLEYKNNTPLDYKIYCWKQEIKLGRDNLVNIDTRAIDSFSGLKIIITEVSERVIKNGICFLNKRSKFEFYEKEKYFNQPSFINETPIIHIKALETGGYFSGVHLDNGAFAICKEGNKKLNKENYYEELLKFKYEGVDHNGKHHIFEMDIIYILEESFSDAKDALLHSPSRQLPKVVSAVTTINELKIKHSHFHKIVFEEKLAFAKSIDDSSVVVQSSKNTELVTKEVLLYTELLGENNSYNFNSEYPLVSKLLYTRSPIPQIEGLETTQSYHYLTYAKSYIKHGFSGENITKIFLKRLSAQLINNYKEGQDLRIFLEGQEEPYTDFMPKDHVKFGPIGNTNSSCEGIFLLEQAIVLSESVNDTNKLLANKSNTLNSLKFQPSDFLGVEAELMGGIRLQDILEEVLDLEDLPITNVLEDISHDIEDIKAIIKEYEEQLNDYLLSYEKAKKTIQDFPQTLRKLEKKLIRNVEEEASDYLNQWVAKYVDLHTTKLNNVIKDSELKKTFDRNYSKYEILAKQLEQRTIPLKKFYEEQGISLQIELKKMSKAFEDKDQAAIKQFYISKTKVQKYFKHLLKILAVIRIVQDDKNKSVSTDNSIWVLIFKHYTYTWVKKDINLKAVIHILKDFKSDVEIINRAQTLAVVDELILHTSEIYTYSEQYYIEIQEQVDEEFKVLSNSVGPFISKLSQSFPIDELIRITLAYELFLAYKEKYYEAIGRIAEMQKLIDKFQFSLPQSAGEIEPDYILNLRKELDEVQKVVVLNIKELMVSIEVLEVSEFDIDKVDKKIELSSLAHFDGLRDLLSKTDTTYKVKFEKIEYKLKELRSSIPHDRRLIANFIDEGKSEIENEINKVKVEYAQAKADLKGFPKKIIEKLEAEAEGSTSLEKIKKLKSIIKALKGTHEKIVQYKWQTTSFKSSSFGLTRFLKRSNPDTAYSVDFNGITKYGISLDQGPQLTQQSFKLVNRLSNFGIALGPIVVNFKEFRYESGSQQGSDVSVKIKDVQFTGALNFIKAFQKYLQSLDKNMILQINEKGAKIGYSLPLPDLIFGYLNFSQLKLSMSVTLPFLPKIPTLINVGINHPTDRFLVVVNGYPGSGYFNIALDPKVGIVSIAFVVEFEANFYFNLGVAKGNADLLAGFYFRKVYDKVELMGNLSLSGNFKVISLFSASVVFDMTLKGNGDYLEGHSNLKVSYRFSRWFKVSVRLYLYRKFNGANEDESSKSLFMGHKSANRFNKNENSQITENRIEVIDSNVKESAYNFFNKEHNIPWLVLRVPLNSEISFNTQPVTFNIHKTKIFSDVHFEYYKVTINKINQDHDEFELSVLDEKGETLLRLIETSAYSDKVDDRYKFPDGLSSEQYFEHYLSYQ
jgi:hypothetical protein